jgi:hypothetical protein
VRGVSKFPRNRVPTDSEPDRRLLVVHRLLMPHTVRCKPPYSHSVQSKTKTYAALKEEACDPDSGD